MIALAHAVGAWFALAATPHPRATFTVTVKRRIEAHAKFSTWTDLTIRHDGTLQTSPPRRVPPVATPQPAPGRTTRPAPR